MIQLKASVKLYGPDKLVAIMRAVKEADGWQAEVGWKGDARYPDGGPRIAQVAIWNELGTYNSAHEPVVPARPFMRPAYDKNKADINRMRVQAIQNVAFHGMPLVKALSAFGYRMAEHIRNEIKQGEHRPNAPSVTERKRHEGRPLVPLINTRLMLDTLGFWVTHNDDEVSDGGELKAANRASGKATREANKVAAKTVKTATAKQLKERRDALVAASRAHAKEMRSRAAERAKVRKAAKRDKAKGHKAEMAMRKKDRVKIRKARDKWRKAIQANTVKRNKQTRQAFSKARKKAADKRKRYDRKERNKIARKERSVKAADKRQIKRYKKSISNVFARARAGVKSRNTARIAANKKSRAKAAYEKKRGKFLSATQAKKQAPTARAKFRVSAATKKAQSYERKKGRLLTSEQASKAKTVSRSASGIKQSARALGKAKLSSRKPRGKK